MGSKVSGYPPKMQYDRDIAEWAIVGGWGARVVHRLLTAKYGEDTLDMVTVHFRIQKFRKFSDELQKYFNLELTEQESADLWARINATLYKRYRTGANNENTSNIG